MAYKMYIDGVLFPVTPSKIKIKIKNQNKTINLVNEGEVNKLKTPGLTEYEIGDLLLPAAYYPFAEYENNIFLSPKYYLDKFEEWKKDRKAHKFVVTRLSQDGNELDYKTSKKVSIEDYSIVEDSEKYGLDMCVQMNLKEYIEFGSKKIDVTTGKVTSNNASASKTKTYTVKKGDTLMSIAKKKLGKSSKWKTLYKLNKKVIEKAAKKHGKKSSCNGRYLYKGTKLKLK